MIAKDQKRVHKGSVLGHLRDEGFRQPREQSKRGPRFGLIILAILALAGSVGLAGFAGRASGTNPNPQIDSMRALLDQMHFPAWAKEVEHEDGRAVFRMAYVNDSYTEWFDVSSAYYVGKTDFEVWPQDVAMRYYTNDAAVYASRGSFEFVEPVFDRRFEEHGDAFRFSKFFVEVDGRQMIVGWARLVEGEE